MEGKIELKTEKEVSESEIKSEYDPGEKFLQSGGKILEMYPKGKPKRWKCGIGKNGDMIDPEGMEKEAIHLIDDDGKLEGGNPDEELLKEIKRWRSDWMDA